MPQPPRTLGQMTSAPRRNMTPEEISALWAQQKQGMERTIPLDPFDIAPNNPISTWIGEAVGAGTEAVSGMIPEDWQKYAPLMTLLGLVRYKKPGVSASARQTAEQYHRRPVSDPIQRLKSQRPAAPARTFASHVFETEDGFRFYKVGDKWVDNLDPDKVDLSTPAGADGWPYDPDTGRLEGRMTTLDSLPGMTLKPIPGSEQDFMGKWLKFMEEKK